MNQLIDNTDSISRVILVLQKMYQIFLLSILGLSGLPLVLSEPSNSQWSLGVNGKEYLLFPKRLSFQDGKAFCESINGRLPQIASEEENYAITRLIPSGFYIWLNGQIATIGKERKTSWLDGSQLGFANWDTRGIQPDLNKEGINLDSIGRWTTENYRYANYIVCERKQTKPDENLSAMLNEIQRTIQNMAKQIALNQQAVEKLLLIVGSIDSKRLR